MRADVTMNDEASRPARPGNPLLTLRGVGVSFGGVMALDGVSAEVDAGEIVAVVGPNGAGKTTLLNAINGFLRRVLAAGSINLGGREITGLAQTAIARLGVARSFQEPRLIEHDSARENILCGAHQLYRRGALRQLLDWGYGGEERIAQRAADEVLEMLGLQDVSDARTEDLSYGHRKMIDIGRALMSGPALLLLDEPSSGLDEREQARIVEIVREYHSRNRDLTILVVEHHMPLVQDLASRLVAMHAGTVLMDGELETVMSSREFRAALTGQPMTDEAIEEEG